MDQLTQAAALIAVVTVIAVILDSIFMWPQAIKLVFHNGGFRLPSSYNV